MRVILDNENAFVGVCSRHRVRRRLTQDRRPCAEIARKIELNGHPVRWLAVDANMTVRLLDKAVYLTEPQTRAPTRWFSRKEWFESLFQHTRVHPWAIVGYGNHHVLS